MGRPTSEFYRRIAVGTLDRYTGKDHRVTRDVIGWLAAGTESTRTGVMRIHTGAIADDLGWPRGQIEAAIQRLASDGLAVWSPAVRVIACAFVVDVLAVFTENHRKSCLNHLDTLPQCDATEYARKVIQAIEITRGEGASNAPYNAPLHGASNGASNGAIRDKGEGIREKGEGNKTAIAVHAPAFAGDPRPVFAPQTPALPPLPPLPAAAPTGWGFDPTFRTETPVPIPIKLTPEPLPPEPMPEEPPEDFPEVDWSSIPRTIPDLLPPEELDVAPVPKLTEAAKARLQAAQAELRLTTPKPERKPPTPAQLDAMFAKEQLKIAVDLWNEALGKTTCGPADFKALQKLAGTLMGNLAKFSHQYGDSPAIMIGWAAERSEYHGGKGSRSWTFQQWFTSDHLAAVYADYRKDRGDQRKIHYVPERNLRAWRLENEERAKCIAEGRIYGAVFEPMPEVA